MRVRASAGAASYRRRSTLERFLDEAEAQVDAAQGRARRRPGGDQPADRRGPRAGGARARRAGPRGARALPELEAAKRRAGKPVDEARASTSDPEARVMKMADGGYRPAYNVQFAADTESQVIVGLDVTPAGTDHGQLRPDGRPAPAALWPATRTRCSPTRGFQTIAEIDELSAAAAARPSTSRSASPRTTTRDPHRPLPDDSPAVAAWRVRMGTAEAKEIYKQRAATAECVNAIARNRGLQRFGVRGPDKARAIALWFALAHNLMRTLVLRTAPAAS